MMNRLTVLFFLLLLATAAWSQQDPCAGYQDSPDSPHKGPRKFNVIHLGFSGADSNLLVVDPQGHRFGVDTNGKAVPREIARAFYQDDNTAESDTGLPRARRPAEITIHYAQSGAYLIVLTARKDAHPWLKVKTSTCGRRWQKETTAPPSRKNAVTCFTLIYDSHAVSEPQLLEGDHTGSPKSDKPSSN